MSKRLVVLVLVACSCAILFSGCRRTGKKSVKNQEEFPPINVTNDPYAKPPGELTGQPGKDALGTRLDKSEADFANVLFDYDSARINASEMAKIEAVAAFLQSHSDVCAAFEGHCDERGTAEYNMSLGERRALAVRAHMIGLGIDGAVLFTKSFGKEKPVAQGHTEAVWRLNRRVEFALYRR